MNGSVALLCPSYSRGLQDYTRNLAAGLDSVGLDFTVYTNTEYAHLDSTPNTEPIFTGNPVSDVRSLADHLRSQRPGIVHSQSTNLKLLTLLVGGRLALDYQLVVTPHSSESTLTRPLHDRLKPHVLRRCDGLIWHTEHDLENVDTDTMPPQTVIEHGNYAFYAEGNDLTQREARAQLGLPQEDVVFLFFGYIRPSKRLDLLIEAFADLPLELRDTASLVIAGKPVSDRGSTDGEPFADYEAQIDDLGISSDVYVWPEFIDDESIPAYFTAADAVVTPYDRISESGVVHIAFAFGQPVIASRVGGFEERLTDGEHGYLFEAGSAGSLQTRLKRAIRSRAEIETIGEENRVRVQDSDWESIAAETVQFYSDIHESY